ncbi:uncharacterized protein LOC144436526 isoform X2 [Glandiceps talaboti]
MEKLLLTGEYTLKSMKPLDLSCTTKEEIKAYFENSYSINESLFTGLKDESVFFKCPDRLRLPLVFYYAHTATVYVNKLLIAGLIKERVNFDFETLFETGVDEMSWDDTENYRMGGSFKWPSVQEVVDYRREVKNLMMKVIEDTPLELPITMESPWWALFMGMEHERIHIETSSVLIRQLPVELVQLPRDWKYSPMTSGDGVVKNTMIRVEECNVTLGKPVDFPSYGWDNEYPELKAKVPTFEASKYIITNREFYDFVKAGGYQKKDYWSDEGWQWKGFRQANHPSFWVCTQGCKGGCGGTLGGYSPCRPEVFYGGNNIQNGVNNQSDNSNTNGVPNGNTNTEYRYRAIFSTESEFRADFVLCYRYRAIFSVMDMPWDWPVDVNYHEARAFCAWKGPDYRVLTEAEHHAIRDTEPPSSLGVVADSIYDDDPKQNLNLAYGSSTPVNFYPANEKGFCDVRGNVWQWVEDNFNGFPGSKSHYLYDDFSTPCFDGKHTMMQGCSWVSSGDSASRYCRFSFRRHFFQHLGFRLARSICEDEPLTLRLVGTPVFELGQGVIDNKPNVKCKDIERVYVPSTNTQYCDDTDQNLSDMLKLQFAEGDDNYVTKLMQVCQDVVQRYNIKTKSVIHFGCGPGRLAFELTKTFEEVIGVDFGGYMIDAALKLQTTGTLTYPTSRSEDKGTKRVKNTADEDVKLSDNIDRQRVTFKQLTWIPNELFGYNLTIQDMTDRVMNTKAWLVRLFDITLPDGIVAIVSSTDWNKDKLESIIGSRLNCVETLSYNYMAIDGTKKEATVTLWKKK